jgi:hypothetical protein
MIGGGQNKKSIAYVRNVAQYLEYCISLSSGTHIRNYTDKPDFKMSELADLICDCAGRKPLVPFAIPARLGLLLGKMADLASKISGHKLPISEVRIMKFLANTQFKSAYVEQEISREYDIEEAVRRTIVFEFQNKDKSSLLFVSE